MEKEKVEAKGMPKVQLSARKEENESLNETIIADPTQKPYQRLIRPIKQEKQEGQFNVSFR